MDINFNTLFDVDIFHEYYKDGISKDFEITPSEKCKELLSDYLLVFHKTSSGFNVSFNADENNNPIIPIDYQIKLVFHLTAKNTYLLNYTNLPIDKIKNTIYYFTNYNLGFPDQSVLHKNSDYVSSEDRLDLKSETFSYPVTSEESEVEMSIQDCSDETIAAKSFLTNQNLADIQVSLSPFSPGKFKLLIDGDEEIEFYADNKVIGKPVFGVIEIFLDPDSIIPQAFEINFPARKTYWKYNVILKHSTNLTSEELSVDIPKTETDKYGYSFADELIRNKEISAKVLFNRLNENESSDSPTSVLFVFSKELPLSEVTIKGIRLVKINGNGESDYGNPVLENLSNPSIESIKPETETGKVYSEINIYI